MEGNKAVLGLTGIGRSGTTWVMQILNHLSSKKLIKFLNYFGSFHGYWPPGNATHVVIPIRNLQDILVSRWRVDLSDKNRYEEVEKRKITLDEADHHLTEINKQMELIVQTMKDNKVILLEYEKMFDNPKYVFEKIESKIGDCGLNSELNNVEEKYSFKRNSERAKDLGEYRNMSDDEFKLHGRHCYLGNKNFDSLVTGYLKLHIEHTIDDMLKGFNLSEKTSKKFKG